jgi:hypothetical protein
MFFGLGLWLVVVGSLFFGGTVKPCIVAVLRLMTISNWVGALMVMSAGMAPCKTLSALSAVQRIS